MCGHACAAMHALISAGDAALIAADDVELGSRTGQNMEGDAVTRGR